ncbi:MAG: hypothetical protein HC813_02010 [Planctomycetes bacterium]|nr:hypothetical protein [Planctomycetota bacterium]
MSDALAPKAFIQELLGRIEARRTFGGHPLWLEIADGKLDREQLKLFSVQFFLQVREFPRAVSAMHANCPFPKERRDLAESVYEEETGRLSGCNQPHPELFIRFGEAVGLRRDEMVEGRPLPATQEGAVVVQVAPVGREGVARESRLPLAPAQEFAHEGRMLHP